MRKYLLSALLFASAASQAQTAAAPAADDPAIKNSPVGLSLIEAERRHRIEMESKRRELELATMDQRIAETEAKEREAKAGKGLIAPGAAGFPTIPVNPAAAYPQIETQAPAKVKTVVETPLPTLPTLTAVIGNKAVFSESGALVYASSGQKVGGYTVTGVSPAGVSLSFGKKQVEVPLSHR